MKNMMIGIVSLALIVVSCSDDDYSGSTPTPTGLITPKVQVRVTDPLNQSPFSGILEIYPCNEGTSTYFGNYVNGKLTGFNGYYTIVNGEVYGSYNRELHLPIGTYNMVYWGTPKYEEPIYNAPAIVQPGISSGANLSQLYFSLRQNNDTTYMPVYDMVHAVKSTLIGTEDLQAALTRVTAGLKIIVKQQDGSPFPTSVTAMQAFIGNISAQMNIFSAEAINPTRTVSFDLTRSSDGTSMSNATVMLFPSAPNPLLTIVITLADGSTHKLSKALGTTLAANTKLTLNITIGDLLPGGDPGDFTIEGWNEESETIDFPTVN